MDDRYKSMSNKQDQDLPDSGSHNDEWFADALRTAYEPDMSDLAWEEWRMIAKSFPIGKDES